MSGSADAGLSDSIRVGAAGLSGSIGVGAAGAFGSGQVALEDGDLSQGPPASTVRLPPVLLSALMALLLLAIALLLDAELLLLQLGLQVILRPGDLLRLLLERPLQAAVLFLLEWAAPGLCAGRSPFLGG